MNEHPECEHLPPRQRQICRGESGLSLELTNSYRESWGLKPLNHEVHYEPVVNSRCLSETPTVLQKAAAFAKALTNHVRDGLAKCSEAEIQDRFSVCEKCEEFTGEHCRRCGCACSRQPALLNKLAWRSERCPLGKWMTLER